MTLNGRMVALITATLMFSRSPTLWAQEASHKLTVMDEFQLQLPTDPQISPDGKRIVYVRRFADPMTDKRYSNLWIINADGTDHRPLTTGNRSDASPRWSPDGLRLAYLSDADGKQQIYIRWMDTGQTARITNLEQAPDAIAWSPDGKMLSFASLVLGKGPHIADLPAPPSGAKWSDAPTAYDRLVYRSEEHTSELQSQSNLVCRLLLEKKNKHMSYRDNQHLAHVCRSIRTYADGGRKVARLAHSVSYRGVHPPTVPHARAPDTPRAN